MNRLEMIMKVQAIVFLVYAVGWFFMPEFVNDTIFGWETDTVWPRLMGGAFLAIAWGEWRVVEKLEERLDLVWMFAGIPLAFLAGFLWELIADTYPGSDSFAAISIAITIVFGAGVSAARLAAEREMAVI